MTKIECHKRFLIRCCYWYYVKADPMISDRVYDLMFNELQSWERCRQADTGVEPDTDSPTQMIWGDLYDQYPDWAKERKDRDVSTE